MVRREEAVWVMEGRHQYVGAESRGRSGGLPGLRWVGLSSFRVEGSHQHCGQGCDDEERRDHWVLPDRHG